MIAPDLSNKFVKVIVKARSDQKKFDTFMDKIQECDLHDLKIVENFSDILPVNEHIDVSVDDTQSLLDDYVDATETDLDKSYIKLKMKEVYKEAQTLEIM
jgi:hypothetical protein